METLSEDSWPRIEAGAADYETLINANCSSTAYTCYERICELL